MLDRYGSDVLAAGRHPHAPIVPEVPGDSGLVVECATTAWCGAIVGWEKSSLGWAVVLEDRRGARRLFPPDPAAFLLEGKPVTLVRPRGSRAPSESAAASGRNGAGGPGPQGRSRGPGAGGVQRTASGSIAAPPSRARVARASRIWVEGRHDAELVEKVWGDDLRDVGVVVEPLGGIDDLVAAVGQFGPGPERRLAVLVDHLIDGTKESRIAEEVMRRWAPNATVLGHPYVDVWQAVRPAALGIAAWPVVPRGTPWKAGVCSALGWPTDEAAAWRRILAAVHTYADLEPTLLARVEEAIDLVTA